MAKAFCSMCMVQLSKGHSACCKGAYNSRSAIESTRSGKRYDFSRRPRPEHHIVLLPEGAPPQFDDIGLLWNAAEGAEKRKDAQLARDMVMALPANPEISPEDRIILAQSFAKKYFVDKGVAVQLDIHAPDEEGGDIDKANWHAHLLITTRRLNRDGFDPLKARDLDPVVRQLGGRGRVVAANEWGKLWRAHQEQYFRSQGLSIRVDPDGLVPQEHYGPKRMWGEAAADIAERRKLDRRASVEAAGNPVKVLEVLTGHAATFSGEDIDWLLSGQFGDSAEHRDALARAREAVLASPEIVPLYDPATGKATGRFTTRQVRREERTALTIANLLGNRGGKAIADASAQMAGDRWKLTADQINAFSHATGAGQLKLITGRSGAHKSRTLKAIRAGHAQDGKRVVGLAFTHDGAQAMVRDGFRDAATVHSALFRLHNGKADWDADTIIMVDEAAKIDTPVMLALLNAVHRSGAKLILAGDTREPGGTGRGGLFAELAQRHGVADIADPLRQKVNWQRRAARELAAYQIAAALKTFEANGAIRWSDRTEEARAALVAAWRQDGIRDPGDSQFVFAYSDDDVDLLNADLREAWRGRGKLVGPERRLRTVRDNPGEASQEHHADFAVGDRVQFIQARKSDSPHHADIQAGHVATIMRFTPDTGEIEARLDSPDGQGRIVRWDPGTFQAFRHGYAGTIHKDRGRTLDRTYLYHSRPCMPAPGYAALTRQRKSALVFVAHETTHDIDALAGQAGRDEAHASSVAWASLDELLRSARRTRSAPAAGREQADPATKQAPAAKRTRDEAALDQPSIDPTEAVGPDMKRVRGDPAMQPEATESDARFAPVPLESKRKREDDAAVKQEPADRSAVLPPDPKRRRAKPPVKREMEGDPLLVGLAATKAERAVLVNRYRARARRQRATTERRAVAAHLIQAWDQIIAAYREALKDQASPAYDQARAAVRAFAAHLNVRPEEADALRRAGSDLGLGDRPRLRLMLQSDNPERFADNIILVSEEHQARLTDQLTWSDQASRQRFIQKRDRGLSRE